MSSSSSFGIQKKHLIENEGARKYISTQASALSSMAVAYPLAARYVFSEANFVKSDFKQLYKNYFSTFRNNYRGITPYFIGYIGYPLVLMTQKKITDELTFLDKRYLENGNGKPDTRHLIGGSVITGALSAFVYNPLKVAVVRMQSGKDNMVRTMKSINTGLGFFGFYSGTSFYMIRNAAFCTFLLLPFDVFNKHIGVDTKNLTDTQNFFLRISQYGLSSLMSTIISMPMDVFNTMRITDPWKRTYVTNMDIIGAAFKARGVRGFFVGGTFRFLSVWSEFAIFNETRDHFFKLM